MLLYIYRYVCIVIIIYIFIYTGYNIYIYIILNIHPALYIMYIHTYYMIHIYIYMLMFHFNDLSRTPAWPARGMFQESNWGYTPWILTGGISTSKLQIRDCVLSTDREDHLLLSRPLVLLPGLGFVILWHWTFPAWRCVSSVLLLKWSFETSVQANP